METLVMQGDTVAGEFRRGMDAIGGTFPGATPGRSPFILVSGTHLPSGSLPPRNEAFNSFRITFSSRFLAGHLKTYHPLAWPKERTFKSSPGTVTGAVDKVVITDWVGVSSFGLLL